MAALVIRIICATMTSVRVNAGKALLYILSLKAVSASTLASDGKMGHNDESVNIKMYATKNSGKEIVVRVAVLTDLS